MNLPDTLRRFDDLGLALAVLVPISLLFTIASVVALLPQAAAGQA
jgi:hypothetical protein